MTPMQLEIEWETKYSNTKEYGLLKEQFSKIELPEELNQYKNKILQILVKVFLHKQVNVPILVGEIRKGYESAQEAADMVVRVINAKLVFFNPDNDLIIVRYGVADEILKEMEIFDFQPPMLVEPKTLYKNSDSAFYTENHDHPILQRHDRHDDRDYCLDHLNRVNSIAWSINEKVYRTMQNNWNGILHRKDGESEEDFEKKKKAFNKYDRNCHVQIDRILEMNNVFYLAHHEDKRGRTYCKGYYVTYQGNDWNKAIMEFHNKEYVNVE